MKLCAALAGFALGLGQVGALGEELRFGDGGRVIEVLRGDIVVSEVIVRDARAGIWVVLGGHNGIGMVIKEVTPDGPAAKAGLRPGQIITEMDGTRLEDDVTEFKARSLLLGAPGSPVRLEVMDPKDFSKAVVVHLIRKAFPAPIGARVPLQPGNAGGIVVARQIAEFPAQVRGGKLESEAPVGQFSIADEGAAEKVRQAFTSAGMEFCISEGDVPAVRVRALGRDERENAPGESSRARALERDDVVNEGRKGDG